MKLSEDSIRHFLEALTQPLCWCGIAATRWPSVRRRLDAVRVPYLAAPVSGLGWYVVSIDGRLGEFAGEEAEPMPVEVAVMLMSASDLDAAAMSHQWAYLVTATRQQKPRLRVVRAR